MTARDRRAALLASLPEDVDAILVTRLVNVRYLTGFTGSSAALLLERDGSATIATDGRYVEQSAQEAPDLDLLVTRAFGQDLVAAAASHGAGRLAIERHHVTLAAFDVLKAAAAVELVGVGELVEALRVRKDDDELDALRSACAITDRVFEVVLTLLRPGVTERDIAGELVTAMRAAGAEGAAFDSIVAFGPHSAIPHHQPTDRPLERGDLVKLDFGARVRGYHADMTRTVVCGAAQEWQRELHTLVREVQERCRAATVPGAVAADLDALAQQLIVAGGHTLVHGLGHGVGLEIHEQPFLVSTAAGVELTDGVPVTVEPGVYLPGRGGVRIEDTVVVTSDGPQVLTQSPRELVEL